MANKQIENQVRKLKLDVSQVTRTASIFNTNQIQKLWNSTNPKFKYSRKAKGSGYWTYVKVSYVRKVLDSVFGFNWDFDIDTSLEEAFGVAKLSGSIIVKGTLNGRTKVDGEWVEINRTQFGRADVKWRKDKDGGKLLDEFSGSPVPLDLGNDFKAATTDCLKKCASLMGIASDVYETGEFEEIEIIGSDENNEKNKATKEKAKKLRKELKAEEVKNNG